MSARRPIRRVLFLADHYVDPYGGTEGQVHALLGALPSHIRAEMWVLRRKSDWLAQHSFPCRTRTLGLGSLARPGTLLRLPGLAREIRRFDLVQTVFNDASLVGPLLGALAGVPVLVSRRDLGFWQTPAWRTLLRRTNRLARGVVANCEAVARHTIEAEHVPPADVAIVGNGHAPARFEVEPQPGLRARLDVPSESALVGLLANVKPLKRHDDFLAAIARLAARGVDVHALCIGDEVESDTPLAARAAALGIADRVHVVTALGNAIPLLRHLDAGVLCSETEGLSNAVLEYMACSLPVVATRVGGNPDLVEDGENGFLVDVGDVDALTDRIGRLAADRDLAARLGAASRRRYEESYTLDALVARTRRVWTRAVADPRPPPLDVAWEVVQDLDALEALVPAWDDLLGPDHFFLGPDWVLAWLRHGETRGRPHVLVAKDPRGRLVGLLPLVRRGDVLGFAGQGEGADHLDVVARPGRAHAVAHGALDFLVRDLDWSRLRFRHLAEAGALRRAIHDRGWSLPYREFLSTVCPYVSVGDHATYADYVAAHFSYASRRNIRRYPKRFREITGAAVERVSAPVAGVAALRRFFALHDARRADSAMAPPPIRAFHRALVERAARSGRLALTFLTLAGRDIACEYGFRHRKKLLAFQSGLDEAAGLDSPGLVLQAIVLEEDVFGGGLEEYDFLDGTEDYKLRWATGRRRLFDVEVHRPTPLGSATCLLHGAARLAYDLVRRRAP